MRSLILSVLLLVPALAEMKSVPGGAFRMGTAAGFAYERPVHSVSIKPFLMDTHAVTVAEFTGFVKSTGYRTEAEKAGWSGAFRDGEWKKTDGANWLHPEGAQSAAGSNEPVTQVSWNDANAYAQWAEKRLPTEAEFEYAARGGLAGKRYSWGDELKPHGRAVANWWQGIFPERNTGEDGYRGRAPVGKFPPNGYGLYDMAGNVWQWCADWFSENYYGQSPKADPRGPARGDERVMRGGSWMCSENYCRGYRVASRSHATPDSALNNLGFRCVRDETRSRPSPSF